jgi:hypothetical protein
MLDGFAPLEQITNDTTMQIRRGTDSISIDNFFTVDNGKISISNTDYFSDGRIATRTHITEEGVEEVEIVQEENNNTNTVGSHKQIDNTCTIEYYPNGTITIHETIIESIVTYGIIGDGIRTQRTYNTVNFSTIFYTSEKNITKYHSPIQPYEQLLQQNPISTYNDVAEIYVNMNKKLLVEINKEQLNEVDVLVFTADYGLYWWDYQSGYDLVLAELGWNNTVAQEIGLVRGAANLQGKSWGTILTWKYTHPPYLTDGKEMFEQMKTSYEAGAEYVLIFNYSEDRANHNTLQEEHFLALERFWNDVVQNPKVKHGGVKADAVLILPQNYGWGMRHPEDHIWGIWRPDDTSQQIWNQLQNKIDQHGLKLDIVYEDPNYPVTGKYNNIYHWNQK